MKSTLSTLLFISFLMLSGYLSAQSQWIVQDGCTAGNIARTVTFDENHNVYAAGYLRGSNCYVNNNFVSSATGGANEGFLIKLDKNGNPGWYKHLDESWDTYASDFHDVQYHDGYVYACGTFVNTIDFGGGYVLSGGSGDAFLAKYDTLGNTIWVKKGGGGSSGEYARGLTIDEFGNIYITGRYSSGTSGSSTVMFDSITLPKAFNCIYVAKYDPNGTIQWVKTSYQVYPFVEFSTDGGVSITCDLNGGLYFTGHYDSPINFNGTTLSSSNGGTKAFVGRMDYDGNMVWLKNLNSNGGVLDGAGDIDADTLGNVYVNCSNSADYYGMIDTIIAPGGYWGVMTKLDYDGNPDFEYQTSYIRGLHADNQANVYIAVSLNGIKFVRRIGHNGNVEWLYSQGSFDVIYDHDEQAVYICGGSSTSNYFVQKIHVGDLDAIPFEQNTCFTQCEGAVSVVPFGGSSPYTYLWSDGSTNDSLTGLCPGNYSVTVYDALMDSVVVDVSVAETGSIDTLLQSYQLTMTAAGGYVYQWYENGVLIPGANDSVYTGTINNIYYTELTDTFTNCTVNSQSVDLTYDCSTIDAFVSPTALCEGDTLFGTVSDLLPSSTFTWFVPGDTITGDSLVWVADTSGTLSLTIDVYNSTCPRDSVIDLTIYPKSVTTYTVEICDGDSALVGGTHYSTSGVYFDDSLQSIYGCDSVVYAQLIVHPNYLDTAQISICQNDTIVIGGNPYFATGIYTIDTLQSIYGCDSVLFADISVLPTLYHTTSTWICPGDSLLIGGTYYSTPGTHVDQIVSSSTGCDSVLSIQLLFIPPVTTTIPASICTGDSLMIGGTYYSSPGLYVHDTLASSVGCDSIVSIQLSLIQPISTTLPASICAGDSMLIGNQYESTAGTYFQDSLVSWQGCDSVIYVNLTVNSYATSTSNSTICSGDSLLIGNTYQSTPGIYILDTLFVGPGCGLIQKVNLHVLQADETFDTLSICPGDSVMVFGTLYGSPGSYSDVFTNQAGCDSVSHIDVAFFSTETVQIDNFSIDTICLAATPIALPSATPAGGSYTGYGVVSNMFNPAVAGLGWSTVFYDYTDTNGCHGTDSTALFVDGCSGIDELTAGRLRIVPNPVKDKATVYVDHYPSGVFAIEILDPTGKIIRAWEETVETSFELNTENWKPGTYLLRITPSDFPAETLRFVVD